MSTTCCSFALWALTVTVAVVPAAAETPAPASAPPAEAWYTATLVGEKVWRIDDHGSDNMYLVEGAQKALLVDTGLGLAKLADFVKTLTKLPVIVVNTHGHPDHSGGNDLFPEVYAHPADFDAIRAFSTPEARRGTAERMAKGAPTADWLAADEAEHLLPAELLPLKDGQAFDLGGRTLEVIEQPGHTPGEIVLLDKVNRLVITGDNNNTLVWLFLPSCRPLEVYLQSLKKLKARAGEFDTLLPGHGGPLPKSHLDDQIACVEEILSGTCKDEPYESFVGPARLCKHGGASVAFDPKNLRAR
jgi:hydroxyacylglutathione hydrolase